MVGRIIPRLIAKARRFRREDEGSIVVEAMIMFPLLFATVLATFVFFDAFRNQSVNLKANYTISDAISREDQSITNTYMINAWNLHRFLTNSSTLTQLRVSLIQYVADEDKHYVVWSRTKGGGNAVTDGDLEEIGLVSSDIPVLPDLERLIVVQTSVDYEPNFSIGLSAFTFDNMVFTRPRGGGQSLCYSHNGTLEGRICPADSG